MSHNLYDSKEWKEIRSYVWERDDYRCFVCGVDGSYKRQDDPPTLNTHHVIPMYYCKGTWLESAPINLVTTCKRCHKWIHSENWTNPRTGEKEKFYNPFKPDDMPERFERFAVAYFFVRLFFPGVHGDGDRPKAKEY